MHGICRITAVGVALAGFALTVGGAVPAQAGITFVDRTSFETAVTITIREDFESLATSTSVRIPGTNPLTLPSDLVLTSGTNALYRAAPNTVGNPTTAVGTFSPIGTFLRVALPGDFQAFGLDLYQNLNGEQLAGPSRYRLTLFNGTVDVGQYSAVVQPNTGSFFGLQHDEVFDSVQLEASFGVVPSPLFEVIDNVAVGNGNRTAAPIPEPQTWAMMLLGFGLVATRLLRPRQAA